MCLKDPFAQFRAFINLMETRVESLAKSHGVEHLSGPQGLTVMYLWKKQGQEVFIKDIEKKLDISKSVASNLIKRMEKNGFVQVIPSEQDKRYKQVVLTKLGREKAGKIRAFHDSIHSLVLEGISQEDLAIAQKVILQIKKNLEKGVEHV